MDKVDSIDFKNDVEQPVLVSGISVVTCFAVKKLTGISLGIDCNTLAGAAKAFILITSSGVIVKLYNKKKSTQL